MSYSSNSSLSLSLSLSHYKNREEGEIVGQRSKKDLHSCCPQQKSSETTISGLKVSASWEKALPLKSPLISCTWYIVHIELCGTILQGIFFLCCPGFLLQQWTRSIISKGTTHCTPNYKIMSDCNYLVTEQWSNKWCTVSHSSYTHSLISLRSSFSYSGCPQECSDWSPYICTKL